MVGVLIEVSSPVMHLLICLVSPCRVKHGMLLEVSWVTVTLRNAVSLMAPVLFVTAARPSAVMETVLVKN